MCRHVGILLTVKNSLTLWNIPKKQKE